MANQADFEREMARLEAEHEREQAAREKAYDMHGGDWPGPDEEPVPYIITQFGDWAVTPHGIECLVYPYKIQWDSLTDEIIDDEYWLKNLATKEWVNLHDFTETLRHGRQIHRYLSKLHDEKKKHD